MQLLYSYTLLYQINNVEADFTSLHLHQTYSGSRPEAISSASIDNRRQSLGNRFGTFLYASIGLKS